MLLIDGHEDLAWNALELGRDETCTLAEIREREGELPAHGEGTATVSLPALRAADVRIVMATLFTYPDSNSSNPRPGYSTPEEAFQRAQAQVDYYQQLHNSGEVTLLRSRDDLEAVLAGRAPRPGLAMLMEGADPLRTPAESRAVSCGRIAHRRPVLEAHALCGRHRRAGTAHRAGARAAA